MIKHDNFSNFFEVKHPLIDHKLAILRDKGTLKQDFAKNLHEIALLMTYAFTNDLKTTHQTITTPICDTQCTVLADDNPVIVPILRAGLGMSAAVEQLIPTATIGHVGVYRDPETHEPVEYLVKLGDLKGKKILLVDPMLATGHSAKYVIDILLQHGASEENINFLCLVAAPEGVTVIDDSYPQIKIIAASLDEKLNENAYIVPGLGDAGDRLLGTE